MSVAGLPDQVVLAAIPLIMTVDGIIARARSGVNVMSDMLVAILLDVGQSKSASATKSIAESVVTEGATPVNNVIYGRETGKLHIKTISIGKQRETYL